MKKHFKILISTIPIIISLGSVGIYYIVFKNNKTKIKQQNKCLNKNCGQSNYVKNIFPNITFDEVYDEIIMENNKPIINDAMIAKFIKIVFMRINTSYGEIRVEISRHNKTLVELRLLWVVDSKIKEEKIYKMELKF